MLSKSPYAISKWEGKRRGQRTPAFCFLSIDSAYNAVDLSLFLQRIVVN